MSKLDKKEEKILLITSIAITIIILLLALLSPILLTKCEILGIATSNIIDVYSGVNIMTPFVAIASVVVTYLAFYMQYKANVKLKEDAERQELDLKRQQLERQFYEMLKIHKDNVNEIKWEYWGMISSVSKVNPQNYEIFHIPSKYGHRTLQGRNVFNCYLAEFNLIFNLLVIGYQSFFKCCKKRHLKCPQLDKNKILSLSFNIFLWGKSVLSNELKKTNRNNSEYKIIRIQKFYLNNFYNFELKNEVLKSTTSLKEYNLLDASNIMYGHYYELNHYYRHLYQIVKYVATYNEEIISYEEKRKYLRMLRAQLTKNEQLLLFYNWKSGYGNAWESLNGNHFFTDYRMIHNIDYRETCYYSFYRDNIASKILVNMLKKCNNSIRSEKNKMGKKRTDDYLFEFQNRFFHFTS